MVVCFWMSDSSLNHKSYDSGLQFVGQEKPDKHKHFERDGVQDKQEPSLGQTGPLPGTNWDPSLGQSGLVLVNSTVKSPFCSVCPWDGWGVRPWDDCLARAVRKIFMFFSVYFLPPSLTLHSDIYPRCGWC